MLIEIKIFYIDLILYESYVALENSNFILLQCTEYMKN